MITHDSAATSARNTAYAHSRVGEPQTSWHTLSDHLISVGQIAHDLAYPDEIKDHARLAGLWHDLGKYAPDFQMYLRREPNASSRENVDHSSAGAVLAMERGVPHLAFLIAGHHAGLADRAPLFRDRLVTKADRLAHARPHCDPPILTVPTTELPQWALEKRPLEFLIRMLFSSLIDADRRDTELFFDQAAASQRTYSGPSLPALLATLETRLVAFDSHGESDVSRLRATVSNAARDAGALAPGFFQLEVPTGLGKTLAGMRFALTHARAHGLERVIVAIPYMSITEQTAAVYREIFGSDVVIEHQSSVDPIVDTDANRRAAENWDAPIIVTTNVQLFESIFTAHPSKARKIHALAKSVIILDEVQTLPTGFLEPILDALTTLVKRYRTSVVFSTATQPAFAGRQFGALEPIAAVPIVADTRVLYRGVERVTVELPADFITPTTWTAIAERVQSSPQALVITHQRRDARELAELIPDALHVSASMCAVHRTAVITAVKARLSAGIPCWLVATQVVEAGVDIDFPHVLRAFGPLDAMAQAAGRCNREGRLRNASGERQLGHFEVFVAPSQPPPATRTAISVTKTLLRLRPFALDDPTLFTDYYDRLYRVSDTDANGIQAQREQFNFATVDELFQLIDDTQQSVVVSYEEAPAAIARLRRALEMGRGERAALRALQRFIVTMPRRSADAALADGDIELVGNVAMVLRSDARRWRYDERFGLVPVSAGNHDNQDASAEAAV